VGRRERTRDVEDGKTGETKTMMTNEQMLTVGAEVDTSPAAVARLIAELSKHDARHIMSATVVLCRKAAATLTALAKERDEARTDATSLRAELISAEADHDALRAENERMRAPVAELLAILETVETTEEGRVFHPTTIQTCRCAIAAKLDKIMPDIRAALAGKDGQP
jgi:DNA repair exonuclease SbcCD ATPase subunit